MTSSASWADAPRATTCAWPASGGPRTKLSLAGPALFGSGQVLPPQLGEEIQDALGMPLRIDQPTMGERVRVAIGKLIPDDRLHWLFCQEHRQKLLSPHALRRIR